MKSILDTARSWLSPYGAVVMVLNCLLLLIDGPLFFVASAVVTLMGASAMTLHKDFGKYRKTWEVIASGQVKVDKSLGFCMVLFPLMPTTSDLDYVALIKPEQHIVLLGGGHLNNSFATYTNPWSLFWYLKIRRRLRRIDAGEEPMQVRRADRLSELMG